MRRFRMNSERLIACEKRMRHYIAKKVPTRDSLIPHDVRKAKHIRYLITERAKIGNVEDAEVLANESFNETLGDGDKGNGMETGNGAAPVHIPTSFDSSDELTHRAVTSMSKYDSTSRNG